MMGIFNIVKMSVLLKVMYRLNTIYIKILTAIVSEMKNNPQIPKEFQGAL